MAAVLCQCHGLRSHLESHIVESRTLRLMLPSSKSLPLPPPHPIDLSFQSCFRDSNIKNQYEEEENNINNNNNRTNTNMSGGWSFLEALSNVSQGTKEPSQTEEATYVPPQQKRSSLLLSPKSLELCTENLGNESGTDIVKNGIDMLSSTRGNLGTGEQKQQQQHQPQEQQPQEQPRQHSTAKKAKALNFPPPLTTIRGPESLRVRPHREDGRLVIEVTRVPPSPSCFQAERSHGRLRLCLLKNHDSSFDPEGDDVVIDENEPMTNEGFEEEYGNEVIGQAQDIGEEEEEEEAGEEETEEAGEEGDFFACGCEEIKGGGDMRMEKFEIEMPRRCKEGCDHEHNELLLNWGESFLVATS